MSSRGPSRRRAGKLSIAGRVVPPGTMPTRSPGRLAVDERHRLALVALGELILKVQQGETTAERPRPTVAV